MGKGSSGGGSTTTTTPAPPTPQVINPPSLAAGDPALMGALQNEVALPALYQAAGARGNWQGLSPRDLLPKNQQQIGMQFPTFDPAQYQQAMAANWGPQDLWRAFRDVGQMATNGHGRRGAPVDPAFDPEMMDPQSQLLADQQTYRNFYAGSSPPPRSRPPEQGAGGGSRPRAT